MDFFDLAVRRITRRVDRDYKSFKKASEAKKASYRQFLAEPCHRLERFAKKQNSDFMEIYWDARSANNPMQIVTDPILDTADAQGMAYSRMKKTNISSGINPAFNRSCRGRVVPGKANINNRRPFCFLLRKRRVWLRQWKYLARKFQVKAPALTNPLAPSPRQDRARRSVPLSQPPHHKFFHRR